MTGPGPDPRYRPPFGEPVPTRGGHPGPGAGPPGWGAYGPPPYGPGFQPKPTARNRKPLLITAGATVVVLVVVGLVVAFLVSTDGGKSTGAPDAVSAAKAYLQALARGDARAALELSAVQPNSTELLTDEVLKTQIGKVPITDIHILGETQSADDDATVVRFGVTLGDTPTESRLTLVDQDGEWKLRTAFVDLAMRGATPEASSGLLIFGKPIDKSGHAYVFPGYLEVTPANPYLTVETVSELSFDRLAGEQNVRFWYDVTDAGRDAAAQAVRDHLTTCFSPGPKSAACLDLLDDWGAGYDLTTTNLTSPVDVGGLNFFYFDKDLVRMSVFGDAAPISFTVRSHDGQVHPQTWDRMVFEKVDLLTDPPVVVSDS